MKYTTGNTTVDKMVGINITGNVIPQQWYSSIVRDNGKPYLAAIVILADIAYWYKPTEVRDELTGQIKEYKKKFSRDKLQRSYQQLADMFGISKREASNAIIFLEKLGVIKRDFRTINVNGMVCTNVLFIDLIPERLLELTQLSSHEVTPPTFKSDTPHVEKGEVCTQNGGTYTETLTENITEISLKEEKKEKRVIDSKESIPSSSQIDEFLLLYHDICKSLPKVRSLTDKRKKAIKTLLNKTSLEEVKEAFEIIEKTPFLTGNNSRGWTPNIDFLANQNNIVKILEGYYDSKNNQSNDTSYDIDQYEKGTKYIDPFCQNF